MKTFCSKDCPDLCDFYIEEQEGKITFRSAEEKNGRNGFVCSKLKGFYEREITCGEKFDPESLKNAAELIRSLEGQEFLYMRGSGSLGYAMGWWDVLFSNIKGAVFIDGSPCDITGTDAHEYDFGVCDTPPASNLAEADNIIIFGRNAKVVNQHLFAYLLKLKKAGKRILYIDPIRTETVSSATDYIRINPACDGLLCEAYLTEDAKKREEFIKIAGLTEQQFILFSDYVKNGKTAFITGFGLQRYKNGMAAVRWINRLAVKTDNEKYLYYARGSKGELKPVPKQTVRRINISELPEVIDKFPLMVIVGANPAVTFPKSEKWHKALEKVKLISIDTNITETSKHADVFIRAGGMFAQNDIMGSYFFNERPSLRKKFVNLPSDTELAEELAALLDMKLGVIQSENVERKTPPSRKYEEKPLQSAFPYHGKGYRFLSGSHTAYLNSQVAPSLGKNDPFVYISPETAEKESLKENDFVGVFSAEGSFTGIVRVSGNICENTVYAYKSREMAEGYINNATSMLLTDSGTGIAYYDTFVNIVRKKM
ncbi:molybdopterin-dependent oxidoreductase [Geovibrio sp. ADMFC3]